MKKHAIQHIINYTYYWKQPYCVNFISSQSNQFLKMSKNAPSCDVKKHIIYLFIVGQTVKSSAINSSIPDGVTAMVNKKSVVNRVVSSEIYSNLSGNLLNNFFHFIILNYNHMKN